MQYIVIGTNGVGCFGFERGFGMGLFKGQGVGGRGGGTYLL